MANERKRTIIDYIIIVGAPILLLLLWEYATKNGLVNKAILPYPKKVVEALVSLWKRNVFQEHFIASIKRVAIGFAFGTLAGILFGILTGLFVIVDDFFSVLFSLLRSIPTIGMIPLFIMWYGIGEKSKIIIIALGTFWSVLLNTQRGISGTDLKLMEVARILKKNKLTVLVRIIIPASLPSVFTGVRLGISGAWKSVVAAEMIASVRGIGYLIQYAREMSQPAVMFVGLFTLGFVGLALDLIIKRLEKRVIYWT